MAVTESVRSGQSVAKQAAGSCFVPGEAPAGALYPWVWLCALLLAVGFLLLPRIAVAEELDPFRISVGVLDQSAAEQRAAAEIGLLQVLTRITGLKDVPMLPAVRQALSTPERYFDQSQYRTGDAPGVPVTEAVRAQQVQAAGAPDLVWEPPPAPALKLEMRFVPGEVHQLIREARLPMWTANRPRILVLVAHDDGLRRRLLTAEQGRELGFALRQRAAERALPVQFPDPAELRGEDGRALVSVAMVWNQDWEQLMSVAGQLGANAVLLGRVSPTPTEGWMTDWQFRLGDQTQSFVFETHDQTLIGRQALDAVADTLFARFAIYPGDAEHIQLQVGGIIDLRAYGALMRHLGDFDFIDELDVVAVQGDQLQLRLRTQAAPDRLLELLTYDGRLQTGPPSTNIQYWTNDLLQLDWQG